jgi:hypothetical protein
MMHDDHDDDDCRAVGERIGKGNRRTLRKSVPVPLCPPQIPHDLDRRDGKPATNRLSFGRPTLNLEALRSSETSVKFCQPALHITEDGAHGSNERP